jgi:NADH-quinone oxidoreductase subunit C
VTDPDVLPLPLDEDLVAPLAEAVGAEPGAVTASRDGDGTLCLDVPAAVWPVAAAFLRDRCGLDFFDWLSAVDQPEEDPAGLDVVLHVADSFSTGPAAGPARRQQGRVRRALLRTRVPSGARLPSVTGTWAGAAWHERETYEMFGLEFDGFDDGTELGLRKLLLTDEFEGNPLRKSFVLAARVSKSWPGAKEPGESDTRAAPSRRRMLPPGVPGPAAGWGREVGSPKPGGDAR